jgi:hypothetical protein
VACYPVLRLRAPEHSLWRAPRDDLDDSSYQGTVLDFSIFQPQEVVLVGEPGEADTQTFIDTVYAAYLPNKVARRDQQIGGRPSILPGACTTEDGNVGKGSAWNRPQVSGSGILQE